VCYDYRCRPAVSKPVALRLSPPLRVRSSGVSVQFIFANAGLAALILIVVTAVIIAAVVITIARSLVVDIVSH
jgi:hypothetical protein